MQLSILPIRISQLLTASCVMAGALAWGVASDAWAQGARSGGDSALDPVIVTGTRRTDRSATESASAIDVIGGAELSSQPAANMLDAVRNVVPSFYVGQNTISDASSIIRAPSLRGLPSDQVLVMLNGKRLNRSALVQVFNGGDTGLSFGSHGADIGTIPSIAIKRLEVLRDGATAQYGSDAIAGVLNYWLRDDTGFEVMTRIGQYQDQSDGDGVLFAANAGFKLGDSGFVNLSAEYFDDEQTSRGATRPVAVAFAQENPGLADQLPHYPLPAQIWGSSPAHGYKFMLNSAFDTTDSSEIYFFGNAAASRVDESFNFRSSLLGTRPFATTTGATVNLGGRSFFQGPYYRTPCPTGNATCPANGYVQDTNTFFMSSLYPAGFTPRFVGETEQAYAALGYRGEAQNGLTYDVSVSGSRAELALSMYDSISPSFGAATQTSFEFGALIQKEINVTGDFTYEIDAGMASALTLSAGVEYRQEKFEATEGDFQSYGAGPYATAHPLFVQTSPGVYTATGTSTRVEDPAASGYGGTSPTYAGSDSEDSYGVYVGAEGDITERLSMGAAVRYENYDSFGSETVGKLNGIFRANDMVSVRATIGTGFHAPSPGQNNTQILTTNFISGVSVQTGTFPVTSAVAQYFGAVPLKPETSTNYGFGFVLAPMDALSLTLDFYRIDVSDRIFISQNFRVTAADIIALPELASVGVGGAVQYFTSSFDTTTEGVDLVGTYEVTDNLNLTLAYNYNKTKAENYNPAVVSNDQVINISRLAPNHRATLSGSWSFGDFVVNFRESYYGSWVNATDYPTVRTGPGGASGTILAGQEFGEEFTTDVDVSYTFLERYTVTVGGTNVFNAYPDRIAATPSNPIFTLTNSLADGQVYPRNGGPFGINGGYYYASVKIRF